MPIETQTYERCVLLAHQVSNYKLTLSNIASCGLEFRKGKNTKDIRAAIANAKKHTIFLSTRRHFIEWLAEHLKEILEPVQEPKAVVSWNDLEQRCEQITPYIIKYDNLMPSDFDSFGLEFRENKDTLDIQTAKDQSARWDEFRRPQHERWLTLHLTQSLKLKAK